MTETPIDSFTIQHQYDFEGLICFTYFSALKQYWNQFRIDFKTITIHIINKFTKYPPIDYKYYLVAIHSPNILQKVSELDYFYFRENEFYQGKYTQMLTQFLVDGFESNCDEYDIRNEYGTIRMQNDCRVRCIAQFLKKSAVVKSIPLLTFDLVRREHRSSFGNISIPLYNNYNALRDENYIICSEKCKPDCNTRLYFTQINKINDLHDTFGFQTIDIQIKRSSIPEIIVRHSFEMTLISFVCNFEGLLWMWLGFSVLSISKHIFESIRRLISFNGNKIYLIMNNKFITFKNKFKINKKTIIKNQRRYHHKTIYPW